VIQLRCWRRVDDVLEIAKSLQSDWDREIVVFLDRKPRASSRRADVQILGAREPASTVRTRLASAGIGKRSGDDTGMLDRDPVSGLGAVGFE